jgi:putative ABC transport system permease protein
VIVGFVAGAMGIGATLLLCIPLNIVIERLADIADVAKLPLVGGVALIVISMLLTTVAGLIPSRMAAKKDPVVALRTE